MKLEEAKAIIEKAIAEEISKFDFDDITLDTRITYQNEVGKDCDYGDKKIRFITGELLLSHSELGAGEKLAFSVILYSKSGKVKDNEIIRELEDFRCELENFRDELAKSQCASEFIRALILATNEQNEELEKELHEQIAKIDKNVKIMTYATVAVAVTALISIIIVNIFK